MANGASGIGNSGKLVFGGVVALILLGLYTYAVGCIIWSAHDVSSLHDVSPLQPNEGLLAVLSLIGGLASALVVAVMAATNTGDRFPGRMLPDNTSPKATDVAHLVTWAYLILWLLCGIAMLVAWMMYAGRVPALDTAAKSWLGIAVAAGYSYFGIQQK